MAGVSVWTMTSPRTPSVLILLGGMVLAVALAPILILPVREQLHVNCQYGTMGEAAGSWMCADGIGYLMPGVGILVGSILALLLALLVVLLSARVAPRDAATTARILAPAPVLWVGLVTGATTLRSDPLPPQSSWPALWWETVGMAVLISAAGAVLLALATTTGAASRRSGADRGSGRGARRALPVVGAAIGAVLLVAGGLLQPGLMHAVAASSALIAVAWIVGVFPLAEQPGLRAA